ncbi:hypothetical protein F0Q53_02290 [Anaplasma marginale]|uniref:Uncharacterized protein n=2 Tax=Anaplasma marginale TaxID=770 RepID=A0A643CMX3_ANAMA|nr:hypothetical protein [Anaplasma marginale]AGZ79151.1 hypothetical protein U128_04350 [Anaplasma marginale str. Gypsy Plains]AXW85283.1 hypothetical protein BKM88_04280 [Anaplasma marginale]KAA8472553.1 hypothetical protein F0Q58_02750 [Anaplasma marginale]KAA8474496.1 hypothetical protein F0Q53_02290 [Anaplasma marginale]KAB0450974.1 hypothetical protein FY210_02090 [Anaplasma marginale]
MTMSTHLIVDLAFCVGFALAFNPVSKFVRRFLSKHSDSVGGVVEKSADLERELELMLHDISKKEHEVDSAVAEMLRKSEEQYRAIVQNGKKEIEEMLEAQINLATERVAFEVDNFVKSLRLAAVDAASGAARSLLREELEGKERGDGGDVAPSPEHDDDIAKKLH